MWIKPLQSRLFILWFSLFGRKKADKFWKIVQRDNALEVYMSAKTVDINYTYKKNHSFLHRALLESLYESAEALILLGANVNTNSEYYDHSLLTDMVISGDARAVEMLMDAGANPFIKGPNAKTPVETAVMVSFAGILAQLLDCCREEYMDMDILRKIHQHGLTMKDINPACLQVLEHYLNKKAS